MCSGRVVEVVVIEQDGIAPRSHLLVANEVAAAAENDRIITVPVEHVQVRVLFLEPNGEHKVIGHVDDP